ncbi:uncharacterized protein MONOS_12016 [Monocercomonoides exilis]|uniref:uncharacterized protein n=1 Tax=Monocercomonoides exilis TaxID=2049356 RepID=UPI00355A08BC|nr:hypothetical protein MONOS_12016 [Monocercomonoides exilis]|eukprot:MONOS_12016.1-p1 / transcript=MONOS_12016.1 / gene=MONOS_12016 / organism=Monocercomonoides_exilis_PA203 / gene_product=unspecified product / transcript_product=unspecified product / location=Mono_scaffold00636:31661-32077(-) / protein_length=112 / sequence_SO=supercontig / SO=protein_coding / is_pseudo=false
MQRHPELKSSLPKKVDINRFAASCQKILKPCIRTSSCGVVLDCVNEQTNFKKTAERMVNATLVAGIAADGFSLPSVVLWPSANLPKELTTLFAPSLDIQPNIKGWMDKTSF